MFSIVSVPPIVQRAANSPYSHQHLLFSVFDRNHHNECEVVSHCTLGLHFPKHWRRRWHPTPVLLPGKSHGRRSLVGCSPWGRWESDTTELLHFHCSLSCIGEGNGNPLQCSCLENPRDRGACWAAVYGVAQGWTRLKRLSSSSSIADAERLFILLLVICISFFFKEYLSIQVFIFSYS